MSKLFGTDGIRGIVGKDLNIELATKIGISVAHILKENKKKEKLTFLIGTDTRISKDMLTNAVSAGILSEGCDVINVDVLPTPAISYLTKKYQADGGFVISASHNPSEYNGIKVLDENGFKLNETLEAQVEDYILNNYHQNKKTNNCGIIINKLEAIEDYINHLTQTITQDISNLNIIIDTANGAAYQTAEKLFKKLNANYTIINNNPDGININENCGSTHIEGLKQKVIKGNYDIGIAYDGDADRCIIIDEKGNVLDGDYIIAICSLSLLKDNKLKNNTVVGTVMSNLGFIDFCKANNINFIATKVGDKYVLEEMLKHDYNIGGEQSGHIIFKDYANTGDGQLSSLQILNIMTKENKKLSELKDIMKKYPQVMENITVTKEGKESYKTNKKIKQILEEKELSLNNEGRILVRPSGTENLIRVMIEGKDIKQITNLCHEIADFIKQELN